MIRWLAGDRGLLPLPYDILEAAAVAVRRGEMHFPVDWSGFEWLLNSELVESRHSEAADEFIRTLDGHFQAIHDDARKAIQPAIRALSDLERARFDARRFLDEIWLKPVYLDAYLTDIWEQYGFAEPPPLEKLRSLPSWRLFIDAYGIVAYHRAFSIEQGRPIQLPDVLQLVYLSAGRRRMIITEDKPFRSAASAVLDGRYPGSSVGSVLDFLD